MLQVEVVFAWQGGYLSDSVVLPEGATVADAVRVAQIEGKDRAQATEIYGHRVGPDHLVCDGDRIALLRPLCIDPIQARRLRAQAARERRAAG